MSFDDRPIGLFDSGIGGLTVLKALWSTLPNESFIYLGDTARLPYGSKSPQTIERYCLQNIDFLVKRGVKAIVVACNTASTVLLDKPHEFAVPIYNVIEPGAREALKASASRPTARPQALEIGAIRQNRHTKGRTLTLETASGETRLTAVL